MNSSMNLAVLYAKRYINLIKTRYDLSYIAAQPDFDERINRRKSLFMYGKDPLDSTRVSLYKLSHGQ